MRKKSLDGVYDPAEVASLYVAGMSQHQIGMRLGLSQSSVSRILRRDNVPRRPAHGPRTYPLNETYFDVIDTAEKAYWLGFIAADGGVRPGGSALMVHLARRDAGHLDSLRDALETTTPVHSTRTGVALCINSRHLTESVAPLGIVPRKSYVGTPWDGPADLMPHYWRGVIDGDGHISKTQASIALAGRLPVIEAFLRFAHEVNGTVATPRPREGDAAHHVVLMGAWKVPPLVRALYTIGGPALPRKHAAALALLARHPGRAPKVCRLCGAPHLAKGLCGKHYQRLVKFGDPEVGARPVRATCSVCGDRGYALKLCRRHYDQARLPRRRSTTSSA